MIEDGVSGPVEVTVGPGHIVTIHPEVDQSTGHRIISKTSLFGFDFII